MEFDGMFFATPGVLFAEIEEMLGAIRNPEWVNIFDEWKSRLKRCIDAEGEYPQND
jgi:hypothetical protein